MIPGVYLGVTETISVPKKGRNKFEVRLYDFLKAKKVKFSYETEKIPYCVYGNYIPDYPVVTRTGKKIYLEAKGHFRPEAKVKMKAVKAAHPDLDIRIIFYSKNASNIKWALRYGFPYSIGFIPQEWLDE